MTATCAPIREIKALDQQHPSRGSATRVFHDLAEHARLDDGGRWARTSSNRPWLFALAYRMSGTVTDSEGTLPAIASFFQ
jgi:hypothetical protein